MRLRLQGWEAAMAKRYTVRLNDEEKQQLTELLGKRNLAGKKRKRIQVLLKADESPDGPAWIDSRIAEAFDVSVVTVEADVDKSEYRKYP